MTNCNEQVAVIPMCIELPNQPGAFEVHLPSYVFEIHGVVAEGDGSVLVIEYEHSNIASACTKLTFHAVADRQPVEGLRCGQAYVGAYFVVGARWLHIYGPPKR